MLRSLKTVFIGITFIIAVGFIFPGCYTQLSRPQVDIEDEYYDNTEYEEVEEYYQDEGVETTEEEASRDIYVINNYYPSWNDYYYDSWLYTPYYWRDYYWSYLGPYPHYWWDPYGHWWTPGWYAGFYYYDYWWRGSPSYSYYQYGYYSWRSDKTYGKRPFGRRSIRLVDRRERGSTDTESLSKPSGPTRVERPSTTYSTPQIVDKSKNPEQKPRPIREMVLGSKLKKNKPKIIVDDAIPVKSPRTTTKSGKIRTKNVPRIVDDARPTTVKKTPVVTKKKVKKLATKTRIKRSYSKPKVVTKPTKKYNRSRTYKRSPSSKSKSKSYSPGSKSRSPHYSRPSSSYSPRSRSYSSGSRTTSRSSPSRSSSSRSGSAKSGKK